MSNNNNPQSVTTGEVRLSYVHLFKPYAAKPGDEPKFSTTVLVPKTDVATKQRIDAAINAAIQRGITEKWNGVRPPVLAIPVYDGDGVRPNGDPFSEECRGHWIFTASSKQQVEVVDLSVQPILNQTEVYSGMYARVNIQFYPYVNSGKRGIGCGLGPVQKIRDGEPLGSRVSAASAFGDSAAMAPAAAPAQQPAYGQQSYGQPAPQYYNQPAQPQPVAPTQQPQIDPITGLPVNGGVMGL